MINTITSVIVIAVLFLMFKLSQRVPKEDKEGNKVLRTPFLAIFGGVMILLGVSTGIFGFFSATTKEDYIALVIVLVIFLILGLVCFLGGIVVKTILMDTQIKHTNIFGVKKIIAYSDIEKISFGMFSYELKIKSSHQKIGVYSYVVGFPTLLNKLEEKTNISKHNMGVPKFFIKD